MSEPEMYPLTDYPDHGEEFEDFAEIRTRVENLSEGLNFIVAWTVYDEQHEDFRKYDTDETREFTLLIFMPRRSETTQFKTEVFDRAAVDEWLGGYVRARTMRWFGWAEGGGK